MMGAHGFQKSMKLPKTSRTKDLLAFYVHSTHFYSHVGICAYVSKLELRTRHKSMISVSSYNYHRSIKAKNAHTPFQWLNSQWGHSLGPARANCGHCMVAFWAISGESIEVKKLGWKTEP